MLTEEHIKEKYDREVSKLANRTIENIKKIFNEETDLISTIDQIKGILIMYDSERINITLKCEDAINIFEQNKNDESKLYVPDYMYLDKDI